MIVSIYAATAHLEDPAAVEKKLSEIGREEIFAPLYASKDTWFAYYRFIILAYSIDSSFTQLDDDWDLTKRQIADRVGIKHDEFYNDIITLKEPNVTQVIVDYLEYQCQREYKHLIMLKETYNRMIFYNLYGDSISIDQQAKNVVHCDNVFQAIKDYEERIRQKMGNDKVKDHKAGFKSPGINKSSSMLSLENLLEK